MICISAAELPPSIGERVASYIGRDYNDSMRLKYKWQQRWYALKDMAGVLSGVALVIVVLGFLAALFLWPEN
jgi:hypothetical protein